MLNFGWPSLLHLFNLFWLLYCTYSYTQYRKQDARYASMGFDVILNLFTV